MKKRTTSVASAPHRPEDEYLGVGRAENRPVTVLRPGRATSLARAHSGVVLTTIRPRFIVDHHLVDEARRRVDRGELTDTGQIHRVYKSDSL